ncbi:MAG: response regulator [Campylobacterales bacterium]|nr:response regulator [Campylobacterales bacterium]
MHYSAEFQKQTKTQFSLLLAISNLENEAFFCLGVSGAIEACNDSALKLFEVSNLAQLHEKGIDLWDYFVDESPYFKGARDQWIEKVSTLGEQKVKLKIPHAALKIFTIDVQPSRIDGYMYYLLVMRDTTLLDRARQAQSYFETFKQKFLHSISHEFRTPMNAIIGYADLLEHTKLNREQNEYLDMIEKSTSSMMQNIANLLQLMEIENGSMQLVHTVFDPLKEFEQLSEEFGEYAQAKRIQLMFLIDPHLPKSINADSGKIKTVMRALIDNALKFTLDEGSVYVEVKLRSSEEKWVEIECAVTDSGPGIAPQRLNTLLRPFGSAVENRERGINGLGIGLTLSHKILGLMQSKLRLNSELKKGSRFSFVLKVPVVEVGSFEFVQNTTAAIWAEEPRTAVQGKLLRAYLELFEVNTVQIDGLATPELAKFTMLFIITDQISPSRLKMLRSTFEHLKVIPVYAPENRLFFETNEELYDATVMLPVLPHRLHRTLSVLWGKMPREYLKRLLKTHKEKVFENVRILVAEDNLINLKLIETILAHEHYGVVLAKNGQEAVDHYLKEPFDIVLMDIDMPVMDGVTANRLIKEIDRHDNRPYTPVIALTAHALSGDRERILGAGLDAHLSKPIDKELLLHTIERFLEKKERLGQR